MTARKQSTAELRLLRVYFLLLSIGAIAALTAVFIAPSEGSNVWLLGLSKTRWILALSLLGVAAFFAWLFWISQDVSKIWSRIDARITAFVANSLSYSISIIISLIGIFVFFYNSLLTFKFTDAFVQARLLRLLPVSLWLFLFCLLNAIFLPKLRYSDRGSSEDTWRSVLLPALISLCVLVGTAIFVSLTGLGLVPDRTGWGIPGVPLMATQIFVAWLVAAISCGVLYVVKKKTGWELGGIDLAAILGIWLIAIFLWQSQPLAPTFFSPAPRSPNFEFYPYSDASSHDLVAQNLVIGQGFTPVAEKPLYSFFLAVLHVLIGQDYYNIVAAQVVVLAIFPAILYLLAGQMQQRFSGALLAFATILRERNAIALSGQIDVSHSKLLMTDLPTAFALALFMLLLIRWLKTDPKITRWPLLIGGAVGALVLLRSQDLVFLPLVLVLAFLHGGTSWRRRLRHTLLPLFGFALVAVPWIVRNGIQSGQFGYSQPLQALYMAKQYSLTPEANDPGFPPDTPVSNYVSLGLAHVFNFARTYPGEVARFIAAHFLHNEVSSFLTLPIRFDLTEKIVTFYNLNPYWVGVETKLWSQCCSLQTQIDTFPYWNNWNGTFPPDAYLPIAFNLSIIALGLGVAWRRNRWLGILPAGLHLLYNLSTAVARVSGWRLNLPADWVLLLYYCLGIGQLTLWAWAYISGKDLLGTRNQVDKHAKNKLTNRKWLPAAVILLLAGLALPITEMLIPSRYQAVGPSTAVTAWNESTLASQTSLDISAFLEQADAVVLSGRALWPRFYEANAGEPGGQWPAFNTLPFSRLGFVLIGPQGDQVVLPMQSSPTKFPNASDVIVFGCEQQGYLRAVAILFTSHNGTDLLSDIQTLFCSH